MKINKRNIQKVLSECKFDLTNPTIRVIVDVNNPQYYINRAIEELRKLPERSSDWQEVLELPIQLLVLAILKLRP